MLALLDGINKPFRGINFLFDKNNRFFLTLVFFRSAMLFLHHVAVTFADPELRSIA
jgi:hypothetical protein